MLLKTQILALTITALTASSLDESVDDPSIARFLDTDTQLDADIRASPKFAADVGSQLKAKTLTQARDEIRGRATDNDMEVKSKAKGKSRAGWHRWHVHHRHSPHFHHRHHPHIHVPHRHHIHIPHIHVPHRHHIHVPHRHHIHVPHLHVPHRHHIHIPHIHIPIVDQVASLVKKWGSKFKELWDAFSSAFSGFKFKLPVVKIGASIRDGFMNAVKKIKGMMATVVKNNKGMLNARRLLSTEKAGTEIWHPGGAYLIVKVAKPVVEPVVNFFCNLVQIFAHPIKLAINAVMKLVTGVVPAWVIKIAVFGGLGSLIHHFLFTTFTLGAGFSVTYPHPGGIAVDAFEAGFGVEIKDNLQIGKTGCYLAGSSGMGTNIAVEATTGIQLSVFKEYGNIAGETITLSAEGDICKIFGLPCKLELGGGIIFDNGRQDNGEWKMATTGKACLKIFTGEMDYQQQAYTLEMIQTFSEEEMQKNVLDAAKNFFEKGFGPHLHCLKTIFEQWLGLTMEISLGGGGGLPLPASGSITFDYTYCTDGTFSWKHGVRAPEAPPPVGYNNFLGV
jgi:hypothetical protein